MRKSQFEDRVKILDLVMKKVHGCGVDKTWKFNWYHIGMEPRPMSNKILEISNSFHCMNNQGAYCGWADFSVIFNYVDAMDEYRIVFHGQLSQRLQQRHDIREYLDEVLIDAIHCAQEDIISADNEEEEEEYEEHPRPQLAESDDPLEDLSNQEGWDEWDKLLRGAK